VIPCRLPKLRRATALVPSLAAAGALVTAVAAGGPAEIPAAGPRPNVVIILADDLGWADLGCYGNAFNETPHIDRLAREGMRFTQA